MDAKPEVTSATETRQSTERKSTERKPRDIDAHIVPIEQEAHEDVKHVKLSWRSWMVVFVTCFGYFDPVRPSSAWLMLGQRHVPSVCCGSSRLGSILHHS